MASLSWSYACGIARHGDSGRYRFRHDRSCGEARSAPQAERFSARSVCDDRAGAEDDVVLDRDIPRDRNRRIDGDEIADRDVVSDADRGHNYRVATERRREADIERTVGEDRSDAALQLRPDALACARKGRNRSAGGEDAFGQCAALLRIERGNDARRFACVRPPRRKIVLADASGDRDVERRGEPFYLDVSAASGVHEDRRARTHCR